MPDTDHDSGMPTSPIEALLGIGDWHVANDDDAAAIPFYAAVLGLCVPEHHAHVIAHTTLKLENAFRNTNQPEQAIALLSAARESWDDTNYSRRVRGVCVEHLAVAHRMAGNFAVAHDLFVEALDLLTGESDEEIANCWCGIGGSLFELEHYSEAAEALGHAVDIKERIKPHSPDMMWALHNLAAIHQRLGNSDLSAHYLARSRALHDEIMIDHPHAAPNDDTQSNTTP